MITVSQFEKGQQNKTMWAYRTTEKQHEVISVPAAALHQHQSRWAWLQNGGELLAAVGHPTQSWGALFVNQHESNNPTAT